MGNARLNIHTKASDCTPLTGIWKQDLVIQLCGGKFLVNEIPEILDQLKERYAKPAVVIDFTDYSTLPDQGTKTVTVKVNGGTEQIVTLEAGTTTVEQIVHQLKIEGWTDVTVDLVDGHIRVTSIDRGPNATLELGGTSDLVWWYTSTVFNGSGWDIGKRDYNGATRITMYNLNNEGPNLNHIEVDIPTGCYKVWSRICFGQNEETSVVMVAANCAQHYCVNLLLPQLRACAAQVVHPMMDHIVNDQLLQYEEQRLNVFLGVMKVAYLDKATILVQLNAQLDEADLKGDTDRVIRINAVIALAVQLPDCC